MECLSGLAQTRFVLAKTHRVTELMPWLSRSVTNVLSARTGLRSSFSRAYDYWLADHAAAIVLAGMRQRATGRTIQIRFAHFVRFRDGRIIEFREFLDSMQSSRSWATKSRSPRTVQACEENALKSLARWTWMSGSRPCDRFAGYLGV